MSEIRDWLPVLLMLFGAGAAWAGLRSMVKRIMEQLVDVKARFMEQLTEVKTTVAKFESTLVTVAMLQQSVALVSEQVDRVRIAHHDLRENKLSEFALKIARLEGIVEQAIEQLRLRIEKGS